MFQSSGSTEMDELFSYNSLVHAVSGMVGGACAITVFYPLNVSEEGDNNYMFVHFDFHSGVAHSIASDRVKGDGRIHQFG
jgi:hypothetical protein